MNSLTNLQSVNTESNNQSSSITRILLELTIIVSVLSQIEVIEGIVRPVMYASWMVVIGWGIVKNNFRVKISPFTKRFIVIYVAFASFCLIAGQFDDAYLSSNYLKVLLVPLLVTIAGDMYANMDRELLNRLAMLYLISSVAFAVWVQFTYFTSYGDWLTSRTYLFEQKNSAGQIWCSAIFIALFFVEYKNNVQRYIAYFGAFYLFVMTAVSQCRTAILGIAVAVMAYTVSKSKHKVNLVFIFSLLVGVSLFIPFVRDFFEQAFLLNKFEGADLNTFSSGRLGAYEVALQDFFSSPIIGVGCYYVDCSYLSILAESGLLGFCLIESVWLKKIILSLRAFKHGGVVFFMIFFYVVESTLEGYPPFGPGVSSFMFWFLSEILYSQSVAGQKNNEVSK